MTRKRIFLSIPLYAMIIILVFSIGTGFSQQVPLTPQEELGSHLFFDTDLSEPAGQSCASCHDPAFGFTDPDQGIPVSEGVEDDNPPVFGTRNSPSAAYAVFFPEFTLKKGIQGGQFWDGRAANLTEQAKGPFLNPVEMKNKKKEDVIGKIANSSYAILFEQVCGPNAFDPGNVESSYHCMAESIAAFEGTEEFRRFDSKFDFYLAGLVELTPQEEEGRALFSGKGKCGHCHPAQGAGKDPILFTDFKFHNIGLPKNSEFPFDPDSPPDLGLGGVLNDPKENGRFKTPHLRNIELTPPYMHNGVLKTLKDVVHFYNTRDVLPQCTDSLDPGFGITCWAPPEVPENMDSSFMGDLGLTDKEEEAIEAFMKTFTDGYTLL